MNIPIADVLAGHINGEWGFTGTRAGMTFVQKRVIEYTFRLGAPSVVRHGGAFGADTEMHMIVKEMDVATFFDVWPARDDRAKYYKDMRRPNVHVQPIMDPLTRNEEIVKRSKILIGTPHTQREEQRSGTWQTIRKARDREMPILIVWPNGILTLDYRRRLSRVEIPRENETPTQEKRRM